MEEKNLKDCGDCCKSDSAMKCCKKPCCRMMIVAIVIIATFAIGFGFGRLSGFAGRDFDGFGSRSGCSMMKFNQRGNDLERGGYGQKQIPVTNTAEQQATTTQE